MNLASLKIALSKTTMGDLRFYERVGSTNDIALQWAQEKGVRDFSLVVANEQKAGRGRSGRHWETPPDCALAFSLLLLPKSDEAKNISRFTGLAALGVTSALEKQFSLHPKIKWPNDILLSGKKLAGILVETSWLGDQLQGIVIGIGINIYRAAVPPADRLQFPATSLEDEVGALIAREKILHDILDAIQEGRPGLGRAETVAAWTERLAFRSEQVEIRGGTGQVIRGRLLGINQDGSLRLDTHPSIRFGDVHLRPMQV